MIGFDINHFVFTLQRKPKTMTDQSNFSGLDKPTLNSGLNVLTILTFIGSGIAILFSFATPAILKFSKSFMEKAATSGQELTTKQ